MNNQTQTLEQTRIITTTRNTFKTDADIRHECEMIAIDRRADIIIKGIGRAMAIGVYLTLAVVAFSVLFFIAFTIARAVYLELI